MTRSHAYNMLDRVRRELIIARYSISVVAGNWQDHHRAIAAFNNDLSIGDVHRCLQNIQVTYILNAFATWEAILRDFWLKGAHRSTEPELRTLINSIAARRSIDPGTLAATHDIRAFRNEIVHRNSRLLRFDFDDCTNALAKYLSWLPIRW